MTLLTNSANAGTPGATVSPSDTGSGTPWSGNSIGTGASLTYDGTIYRAGRSAHFQSVAAAQVQLFWLISGGTLWSRASCFFPANPVNAHRLLGTAGTSALINGAVLVNTSGKLVLIDSSSVPRATSANSIPLNTWFRLECMVVGDPATGIVEAKLFPTPYARTPTETVTATSLNTRSANIEIRFGEQSGSGTAGMNFWLDDFAGSDTGYPGPVTSGALLAAFP